MFHRIVVGLDGSAPSRRALGLALRLARHHRAEALAVHVSRDPVGRLVGAAETGAMLLSGAAPPPLAPAPTRHAAELVDGAVAELRAGGVRAGGRIIPAIDGVGRALVVAAEDRGADLIVIGTRGRSQLAGLVLGSTAYHVVHLASCPVLVVP
ncbi:MAG TPA: universal stress protein [Verrucomicrobiae bacterium]|nr:universal stress protein [Verrucomicrobiae bacterium]